MPPTPIELRALQKESLRKMVELQISRDKQASHIEKLQSDLEDTKRTVLVLENHLAFGRNELNRLEHELKLTKGAYELRQRQLAKG